DDEEVRGMSERSTDCRPPLCVLYIPAWVGACRRRSAGDASRPRCRDEREEAASSSAGRKVHSRCVGPMGRTGSVSVLAPLHPLAWGGLFGFVLVGHFVKNRYPLTDAFGKIDIVNVTIERGIPQVAVTVRRRF